MVPLATLNIGSLGLSFLLAFLGTGSGLIRVLVLLEELGHGNGMGDVEIVDGRSGAFQLRFGGGWEIAGGGFGLRGHGNIALVTLFRRLSTGQRFDGLVELLGSLGIVLEQLTGLHAVGFLHSLALFLLLGQLGGVSHSGQGMGKRKILHLRTITCLILVALLVVSFPLFLLVLMCFGSLLHFLLMWSCIITMVAFLVVSLSLFPFGIMSFGGLLHFLLMRSLMVLVTLLMVSLSLFLLGVMVLGSLLHFLLLGHCIVTMVTLLVVSFPLALVVLWPSRRRLLVMNRNGRLRVMQLFVGLHAVGLLGFITPLAIQDGSILQQDYLGGGLGINEHIGADGTGPRELLRGRLLDIQRCCVAESHQG